MKQIPPFMLPFFPAFHNNFVLHGDRLQVLDRKFRGDSADFTKPANFSHSLIQERSDDSTVPHGSAALIPLPQNKSPDNAALLVVLHERQLHSAVIRAATAKAPIVWIRCQHNRSRLCLLCTLSALCALHSVSSVLNVLVNLAFLKLARRGCARLCARHAASCAFPPSAIPPKWSRRALFAFRPNRRIPGAMCSAADSARKNNALGRTELRALSNGSAVRSRQIPAAIPAINTYRLPDASSGSLRACACAELHPALAVVKHTLSAFSLRAWRTFRAARIPPAWPAPIGPCAGPWSALPRAAAQWP